LLNDGSFHSNNDLEHAPPGQRRRPEFLRQCSTARELSDSAGSLPNVSWCHLRSHTTTGMWLNLDPAVPPNKWIGLKNGTWCGEPRWGLPRGPD
jgi:hypothetical protein